MSEFLMCQGYTIPWASAQPQFIFPIYFEEGTGKKDTLYIGYDPNASLMPFTASDSIYGVKRIPIDTNDFYVMWYELGPLCAWPNTLCTEVYKANVSSGVYPDKIPHNSLIYCNKGSLPLKISWDISLLNSDSLFYLMPGLPKLQGNLYFEYSQCKARENFTQIIDNNGTIILSDSSGMASDSAVIFNIFNLSQETQGGTINFSIEPWGIHLDISENLTELNNFFEINYLNQALNITNLLDVLNVAIFTIDGKMLLSDKIKSNNTIRFQMSYEGIYIIKLYNNKINKTIKFLNHEN